MSEWLCWVSPCDLHMHIYEPTNALDFNSETLKCWNMEKVDPEMLQLLVLPKWWSFVGHFPAFEGHFSQMTHKCFDKWPRNVYQKFKFESRISPTSPLNLMKARILPYKAYPKFFFKSVPPPLAPVLFELFQKNCQKNDFFWIFFFSFFVLIFFLVKILYGTTYHNKGMLTMLLTCFGLFDRMPFSWWKINFWRKCMGGSIGIGGSSGCTYTHYQMNSP